MSTESELAQLKDQQALQTAAIRRILEGKLEGADGAAGLVVALEGGQTSVDVQLGKLLAGAAEPTTAQLRDVRGLLPISTEASYGTRSLASIQGITLHYTAGPTNQSVNAVAAYQTSNAARGQTGNGTPFPGLAYSLFVEGDGTACLAWDLTVRVWHSAAVVGGLGRNYTHVGICYAGDVEPNRLQILGLAAACRYTERKIGRHLPLEGHRDAPYPTSCPGARWPSWRSALVEAIERLP